MTQEINYNSEDALDFAFFANNNPLFDAGCPEGIVPILSAIDASTTLLRPNQLLSRKTIHYSHDKVIHELRRQEGKSKLMLFLGHSGLTEVSYTMNFLQPPSEIINFWLTMIVPLEWCVEVATSEERSLIFVQLARALSSVSDTAYGYCHPKGDLSLGSEPHLSDPLAPPNICEMYWLNVYGADLVEQVGRFRILSTPAEKIEELPGGGVLLLTRPTPADYASEEARVAQARALAHLRDNITFEDALIKLRERSAALVSVEREWDPDITELLELMLNSVDYAWRQKYTAELNHYRPPQVAEWRPLSQILPSDVKNQLADVERYEDLLAEQFIALLHKYVPEVTLTNPDSLPHIDYHFWQFDYPGIFKRTDIDNDLIPAMGAYLGLLLVKHLGGYWIPRDNIDETQVVVGNRAWLPFLRARHNLRDKQSALDYSLTKFYREAEHSYS